MGLPTAHKYYDSQSDGYDCTNFHGDVKFRSKLTENKFDPMTKDIAEQREDSSP
jgi:hypothetical protein